jgi:heptosyltransferase III
MRVARLYPGGGARGGWRHDAGFTGDDPGWMPTEVPSGRKPPESYLARTARRVKILILKRDKIGDLLLATPMFAHLKRSLPGVELHVLANDYNAWVVENNQDIDRLWVYSRFKHGAGLRWSTLFPQLLQRITLRSKGFDYAIAAGGLASPRAARRIAGLGKRTIAYSDGSRAYRALTDPQTPVAGVHEVEANLRLLAPLGVALPATLPDPEYELPDKWRKFGSDWIRDQGLSHGGFIVIGLNARRAKRKPTHEQVLRWSAEVKRRHGLDTVLIWQPGMSDNRVYPGDDEFMPRLLSQCPSYIHPFRNEDSVLAALGVVWNARAAVFPDGGIAHLASVSPSGVLSLFAETDVSPHPDNWRPVGARSFYLEAGRTVGELTDEQVLPIVSRLIETFKSDRESD